MCNNLTYFLLLILFTRVHSKLLFSAEDASAHHSTRSNIIEASLMRKDAQMDECTEITQYLCDCDSAIEK